MVQRLGAKLLYPEQHPAGSGVQLSCHKHTLTLERHISLLCVLHPVLKYVFFRVTGYCSCWHAALPAVFSILMHRISGLNSDYHIPLFSLTLGSLLWLGVFSCQFVPNAFFWYQQSDNRQGADECLCIFTSCPILYKQSSESVLLRLKGSSPVGLRNLYKNAVRYPRWWWSAFLSILHTVSSRQEYLVLMTHTVFSYEVLTGWAPSLINSVADM